MSKPTALPSSTTTVLRVLTIATFVVVLNETVLVNALPQLMSSLDVDERTAQWLSTGFMLTLAVVIPTTGWLLQRLGTEAAFRLAMGLFLTGTLAAALAPSFPLLLVGRIVQASGTAVMMPLLMTTLLRLVPPHRRGRVMGNVTLAISVAPALGPTVSGLVLQWLSWRWLFGLVLPIALVVALLGLRALRTARVPDADGPRPSLDLVSVALTAVGFGSLIYGLSEAGGGGRGALPVAALVAGALGVALFVRRQLALQRTGQPLLDLRTLLHRQFTVALLLMSVAFMTLMGVMILLPLYLQQVRGLSVLGAGLLLMPGGLLMGLMGPQVGRLYDRLGPRPLVVPGAVLLLLSLGGMLTATAVGPWWAFLVCHVVASTGLALLFTPAFTTGLAALPPRLYPYGSATLGTVQQVAAAAGTALSVAVLSWRQAGLREGGAGDTAALAGGTQAALVVAVALGAVVVVLSTLLRGAPGGQQDTPAPDPARQEHPRGPAVSAPAPAEA
ncbi:DHA2 family efflux MFS transporter permease subunit [Ornithinimicrobium pekingense]|uniref:MFS transporter n=1 Tax=Ornithinimicrobium pekingense TaxID=384677 RepID=A0ABQ2F827_9MICO|nr:DHA2 family efflux MFS transporter permease subunit [Ornithinimicrobium pekingense]GGK61396.1 MFS transporter [Ornithinimicrobium pekingense]